MDYRHTTRHLLMLLVAGTMCCSCSDDSDQVTAVRQGVTIDLSPYAAPMEDVSPEEPLTRAWTPPTDYYVYDHEKVNGQFTQQENLTNKSIMAFFTKDDEPYQQGTFSYNPLAADGQKWQLKIEDFTPGSYFLYGFIPSTVANSTTIAGNSSYSAGAVMSINGLDAVTPNDVCVIVGAKDGISADNDNGLQAGQFATQLKSGELHNYIYLLFDHLYSALRFQFSVDAGYARMRTIKLRKLELKACGSSEYTSVYSKYNASITLTANDAGTNPVTEVIFTADQGSSAIGYQEIFDGETELTTSFPNHSYMGCFVTGSSTFFELRSTYDVYDTKGTLIRPGCQAVNKLDLVKDVFMVSVVLKRGQIYTVNLTVKPTYLYVLSDPDLDSPTVTVE